MPNLGGFSSDLTTASAPNVDTREVSIRPGFGLPAKGYRICIDKDQVPFDENMLKTLVNEIQSLAIEKYGVVDFGGCIFINEEGKCFVQGEFAPNRYSGFEQEDFETLIGKVMKDLAELNVGSVSGGIRDYCDFTNEKIESVVGIEPGYKGQNPFSFNEARKIIDSALDNVNVCQPGLVFYSYMNEGKPIRCTESVVIVEGNTNNPDLAFSKIALGLKQTSVHAVIGLSTGPAIHQAYKVVGALTARESANQ